MEDNSSEPLSNVDPATVTPSTVDDTAVRAALASSVPLVRQRGLEVCRLAETDVDAVRPFLDDLAPLAEDSNAATALRAIAVFDAVAGADPTALDGRVGALARAVDTFHVDIQLTGATALGKVVVERPDLVAPHVHRLLSAFDETELDRELPDYSDVVDDRVTQQTLREKEEGERRRAVSARRTLINVVVAVAEQTPAAIAHRETVDGLVTLFDDVDPGVVGGAVDALAELATADPAVVAPARGQLVECLDHDRTVVRARAVRALGQLGDDAAVENLHRLAASDDDEDVRELAADTAAFLDGTDE
jgi:hypothetical protein